MGTRGAVGFFCDNTTKVSYNHFDSYPAGLGEDVLQFLTEYLEQHSVEELRAAVRAVRLVDEDKAPTKQDLKKYTALFDPTVGGTKDTTWYQLLRGAQGKLGLTLEHGIMIDSEAFLDESLFCEWAYVINCDEQVLEVYRGFNQTTGAPGRYAQRRLLESITQAVLPEPRNGGRYYPVALVATYPFSALPEDLEALQKMDD